MAAAVQQVTFKVSDVKIEKKPYKPYHPRAKGFRGAFPLGKNDEMIFTSESFENVSASFGHGLVGAFYDSYSSHKALVIRPDDVHLAIMLTFSGFMCKFAEIFRDIFVDHEGKEDLHVTIPQGEVKSSWEIIMQRFGSAIEDRIKQKGMLDWVAPTYTTTKPLDTAIAKACLMGMMKEYFTYHCTMLCGIPKITLQGSLEDWQKVRAKAEMIKTLSEKSKSPLLMDWYNILVPILDRFVKAYQGKVDKKWWNSAVNYKGAGSGTPWMSGWALAFVPFDKHGNWQLNSVQSILDDDNYGRIGDPDFTGVSRIVVPVMFHATDLGDFEGSIYAGTHDIRYEGDNIKPVFDLAIVKKGPHSPEDDDLGDPYGMYGF